VEEARAEADAALDLAPDLPEAHRALGRLLVTNQRAEALTHLTRAAAAPEASWAVHYDYACLLLEARQAGASGQDTEIERALRRTIELQPSFPEAYVQLAWIRGQSSVRVEEAIELVKRALGLSPGNQRYWLVLANLYAMNADYAPARLIVTKVVANATDAQIKRDATTLLTEIDRILELGRQ
jgi:tetratricopeptide (TPR) repeat protein